MSDPYEALNLADKVIRVSKQLGHEPFGSFRNELVLAREVIRLHRMADDMALIEKDRMAAEQKASELQLQLDAITGAAQ